MKDYFTIHLFPAPSTIFYYNIWLVLRDHLVRTGTVSPSGHCIMLPRDFVKVWRTRHLLSHEFSPILWGDIAPACEMLPSWKIDPDLSLNVSSMRFLIPLGALQKYFLILFKVYNVYTFIKYLV